MKSPNQPSTSRRGRTVLLCVVVVALTLVATACSGGRASSDQDLATRAIAEQNEADLTLTDDIATTGLLAGQSGEITNLAEVVTGDRSVLVWYWAPN